MPQEESLLKLINKEIEEFDGGQIQIVPGYYFNQKDTINQIYLYHNSKFSTGNTDIDGDRKYFFNITKNPCQVHTKEIDFDTKNIRILTEAGQDPLKTWFFERDLKYWMKSIQFGATLNRIFRDLPVFGSVVIKIVNNKPMFVDLRNFYLAPSADDLDSSDFITEIHRYTVRQFEDISKEIGFDEAKVKETVRLFRETRESNFINIFERYGEIGEGKNVKYKRVYVADVGEDTYDQQTQKLIASAGITLKEEEVDEHPYWEFHLDKIPGRWLGVGVVEALFEPQIKQNETANLESKSAYHLALLLFQTRDGAINRNLLKDSINGDVINADSEITQIGMTYPNLSFFSNQTQKWQGLRDELAFNFDVSQGQRAPAGTTKGEIEVLNRNLGTHFGQIRENIALMVKEMLFKVILPNFEKQNNSEHILRIAGEDLDKVNQLIINQKATDALFDFIAKNGSLPDQLQYDAIKLGIEEAVNQEKETLVKIPKSYYKNLKYSIDIDITGESVNTGVRLNTRQAILQAITADPTMITDPVKRKILFGIAEDGGLSPSDIFEPIKKGVEQLTPAPAGGGVGNANLSQTNDTVPQTTTL